MVTGERYRVEPGRAVDITEWDPDDQSAFGDVDKHTSKKVLKALHRRLAELQHVFWADGSRGLLVVLQAMDTGGKDGTIRKVFSGVNPQGVDVHGFGVPSKEELAHDYLWRVHMQAPQRGRIAIHNRSHYEDVLVVRVEGLVPEQRWSKRYDHIRAFEQLLSDEGTAVVKLFLNISKDEQRKRLQSRLDDPTKRWKFNPADLETRGKWDAYMAAYQDAIFRTATATAPWYIVPANQKWYRNLVVASILVETLQRLNPQYPDPPDLDGVVVV
jgi:PPK2 family polyphosphate:nucleotide phosphotransferase